MKQGFSIILMVIGFAVLGYVFVVTTREMKTEIVALTKDLEDCSKMRESLAIEVAMLKTRFELIELGQQKPRKPANAAR